MEKFCIFCGQMPNGKCREHVIPQWLIGLTGDPKRKAFFGFDFEISIEPKQRSFAFNAFTFPACESCNNLYSQLESKAQKIILTILNEGAMDNFDFNVLLDWLDKVRIGLWLGFLILSKNNMGVVPKFHISSRMAASDRLLFIYKLATHTKGINFFGTESPSFLLNPSSFALRINDLCLFNVSHFNLCGRRLGFPYAQEVFYNNLSLNPEGVFVEGMERCLSPVVQTFSMPTNAKFFQPIFRQFTESNECEDLFDTEYVRKHSLSWEKGLGNIYQQINGNVTEYSRAKNKVWLPAYSYKYLDFLPKLLKQIYEFQLQTIPTDALKSMAKPERTRVLNNISSSKRWNIFLVEHAKFRRMGNLFAHVDK